jgi:hypothetical protein
MILTRKLKLEAFRENDSAIQILYKPWKKWHLFDTNGGFSGNQSQNLDEAGYKFAIHQAKSMFFSNVT